MKAKIKKSIPQPQTDYLTSPCSIKEAVQIAGAVAEDKIAEYQQRTSPLQVAMSIQIEIIKESLIKAGIISEEEFKAAYIERAEEFNKMQKAALEAEEEITSAEPVVDTKMGVSANEIEVAKL